MKIRRVDRLPAPSFEKGKHRFLAGSPVLLRKVENDGSRTHLIYDDPESSEAMDRVIHKKAEEAGFEPGKELEMRIDETFRNHKNKLVDIDGIKKRATVCPVIVTGSQEGRRCFWTASGGEVK